MTQRITYDANGLCTRCGSEGYYLETVWYSCHGEQHYRNEMTPCPCHGWRPIEFLDIPVGEFVDLCGPMLSPIEARSVGLCGFCDAADNVITVEVTHFRPRPQPPEGV